ncbi:MAG: toxin higb- component of a toxin-antitoxin loci [Thiogranum sp.]
MSWRVPAAFASCVGRIRDVKGKRGGLRVIYYYLTADRQIWLFTIYDKDELADLNADEKRALKKAIHAEFAARGRKR